jgi:tRNA (adenine37-N6)-methyltransferase
MDLRAVAVVHSTRAEPTDDHWDRESSTIELVDGVPAESLVGLDRFSHVEVVFVADQANEVPPAPWVRRPRGRSDWPEVGIFAQRNKDRPNRLLVSVAEIVAVSGSTVTVRGLDAIDGTPVLDLKPVMRWGGPRGVVRAPAYTDEIGEEYY